MTEWKVCDGKPGVDFLVGHMKQQYLQEDLRHRLKSMKEDGIAARIAAAEDIIRILRIHRVNLDDLVKIPIFADIVQTIIQYRCFGKIATQERSNEQCNADQAA